MADEKLPIVKRRENPLPDNRRNRRFGSLDVGIARTVPCQGRKMPRESENPISKKLRLRSEWSAQNADTRPRVATAK